MERQNIKRRIWHMTSGTILALLIYYKIINVTIIGALIIIGLIISLLTKKGNKLPIFHWMAKHLERKKDYKKFPYKGSILFLIGALIVMLIYEKDIAVASILVLSIGDSVAPIVGKYGKWKNPFDKNKMIEGSIAGAITAGIAASFFVSWQAAFIAAFIAMIVEGLNLRINDNITMPVIAGIVIILIL